MKKKQYNVFNSYVIRTPLLPFAARNSTLEYLDKSYFKEALYIASPELYEEKHKKSVIANDSKLFISINKYLSRCSFRCTPFGLFAGCSVGRWGDSTEIELASIEQYNKCTRLDMNYVCALIQTIEKDFSIRHIVKYFINDSVYEIADKIRYVECLYKGTKRFHNLVSVDKDYYLEKVFSRAKDGATITEMVNVIIDEDITEVDATNFIYELIDSQLIVSQLQPAITGEDQLNKLINSLKEIDEDKYLPQLIRISEIIKIIDNDPIGSSEYKYNDIINIIKMIGVPFEKKHLLQTDMFKPVHRALLSDLLIEEINDLISFFILTTHSLKETNVTRFTKAFYERYEDQDIPLAVALDNELGLGYPIKEGQAMDISAIIDDLIIGTNVMQEQLGVSKIDIVLLRKYIEAIQNKDKIVKLNKSDFKDINVNYDDLPQTISLFCNILKDKNGLIIFPRSFGGPNAARLLGRFSHISSDVNDLVADILKKDQDLNPDVIIAEISHIPESKIGNVTHRSTIYDYEIHYMVRPGVDLHHQIDISDLMLSIRDGRIVITSKSLGKDIIPRLTNAHNYSYNSMPIYRFLCEMQSQGIRGNLECCWGSIFQHLDYLPRLQYKNHILAREQWIINTSEIREFYDLDNAQLMNRVKALQNKYNLPNEVLIINDDNEMYVDLTTLSNVQIMLSIVKLKSKFILTETLFDINNLIVKGPEGLYTNEFIIPLYKTN